MSKYLSPGVYIKELDQSTFVETISNSGGAYAGKYNWGPVDEITTVSKIDELADRFGAPDDATFISFFSGYNFLAYTNTLKVVRVIDETTFLNSTNRNYTQNIMVVSAASGDFTIGEVITGGTSGVTAVVSGWDAATNTVNYIEESGPFTITETITGGTSSVTATVDSYSDLEFSATVSSIVGTIAAGEPITGGTSGVVGTVVSLVGNTLTYRAPVEFDVLETVTESTNGGTAVVDVINGTTNASNSGLLIKNNTHFDSLVTKDFKFIARYAGQLGDTIAVSITDAAGFATWTYNGLFDDAPDAGEYHMVVIDVNGSFNNKTAGEVLERYEYVSKDPEALTSDGGTAYFRKKINEQSDYLYVGDQDFVDGLDINVDLQLEGGVSDNTLVSDGAIIAGYERFADPKGVDIFYLIMGDYNSTIVNAINSSVVEVRKDCIMFASPAYTDVVGITDPTSNVVAWGSTIDYTDKIFLTNNWKYQYDQWNDVNRWVPDNADVAGMNASTDINFEPWFSPMGYTRGKMRNVIRLAWSPNLTQRDALYPKSINPVFVQEGEGVVLLGDRMHLKKPSYFRQLGVRKMFIIIEKSFANFANYTIGEFNNATTRAAFVSKGKMFMRDLLGRQAFQAFEIICDTTNNTEQVIAEQEFRALVRVLPSSSINFVEITFSPVNSITQFSEAITQ